MAFYDIIRYYIGPAVLIVVCPISTQVLTYLAEPYRYSFHYSILGNSYSWTVVGLMWLWAFSSLWIPGKTYSGPATTSGYVPVYKANGFQFFLVSLISFISLLYWQPHIAVDITLNFHEILATCNIIAFTLCIYLLHIGKVQEKKDDPTETSQYPLVYEFYRGMDLHPRLLGVDVKQLTNCRFGLMAWQLLIIAFYVAGWLEYGFNMGHLVSTILQTIYLGKFYWWETGYFTTLDITLDRAGYYICWGCIVWVPAFYTYASFFFVANRPILSRDTAMLILILGLKSIFLNYIIDWQKEHFREEKKKGNICMIWGRPAQYIDVTYLSNTGKKSSSLLVSGFWGVARHLNYVFEIGLALAWCLPGYQYGILPFSYFIFIVVLLVHRVFRDEEKCRAKYGSSWDDYCKVVPYRMIPKIF